MAYCYWHHRSITPPYLNYLNCQIFLILSVIKVQIFFGAITIWVICIENVLSFKNINFSNIFLSIIVANNVQGLIPDVHLSIKSQKKCNSFLFKKKINWLTHFSYNFQFFLYSIFKYKKSKFNSFSVGI